MTTPMRELVVSALPPERGDYAVEPDWTRPRNPWKEPNMSTMRERLIAKVQEIVEERWWRATTVDGPSDQEAARFVDAILAELETPDEGMIAAGAAQFADDRGQSDGELVSGPFTAMIRAVRGK